MPMMFQLAGTDLESPVQRFADVFTTETNEMPLSPTNCCTDDAGAAAESRAPRSHERASVSPQ